MNALSQEGLEDKYAIKDGIAKLKQEGVVISQATFHHILSVVNRTNIVDINLHPVILSERKALEMKINELKQKKAPVICNPDILNAFSSLIDTFDILRDGDNESYMKMNSFLDYNNEHFEEKIVEFLKNMGSGAGVESFFETMTDWKMRGENIYMMQADETSITSLTFYKTFIKNIMTIYPNMIMNAVDYKDVSLPSHWKLSDNHVGDVRALVFSETSSLQKF